MGKETMNKRSTYKRVIWNEKSWEGEIEKGPCYVFPENSAIFCLPHSLLLSFFLSPSFSGPPPPLPHSLSLSLPRPPHSENGRTPCVLPKCPVKGYFSCDKVRPENCKKRGELTFHPEISLKRGCFFFFSLISLDSWEIIPNLGGYIEHFSWFRGVSKAEKACNKPAKGGFENVGSPQIGGAFKKMEQAYICVP